MFDASPRCDQLASSSRSNRMSALSVREKEDTVGRKCNEPSWFLYYRITRAVGPHGQSHSYLSGRKYLKEVDCKHLICGISVQQIADLTNGYYLNNDKNDVLTHTCTFKNANCLERGCERTKLTLIQNAKLKKLFCVYSFGNLVTFFRNEHVDLWMITTSR